ncbi:hypothetical protein L7F22_037132 [Adiantum nelumboides]|nr:hypothetical protein [Adiantum nelumboides]
MVTDAHRCLLALHPNCAVATPAQLLRTSGVRNCRPILCCPLRHSGDPLCFSATSNCTRSMGADVVMCPLAASLDQFKCTVIKSPSDDREYELVHLPNGLSALIIHDPKITEDNDFDDEDDDEEDYEDEDDEDDDDEDDDDCPDCLNNGVCAMHNDNSSEDGNRRTHDSGSTKKMVRY